MGLDERRLGGLIEGAEERHSVCGRLLHDVLGAAHESRPPAAAPSVPAPGRLARRRTVLRAALAAGAAVAGPPLGLRGLVSLVLPVVAETPTDVEMLQTAAALENLAVRVYSVVASLPPNVSGTGGALILRFMQTTRAQHVDHAAAFNAAAQALGGRPQTGIDTVVYGTVVRPVLPKITGPSDVLGLVYTLEDAVAQTYVRFGAAVGDTRARRIFATVAPVEAQHAAVVLAVKALVDGGLQELAVLPPDLLRLPAVCGSVGFPAAVYPSAGAVPPDEGAVP